MDVTARPDAAPPEGGRAAGSRAQHFPALDGLRCAAFLLIFSHHAIGPASSGIGLAAKNAWIGVDLFFVLSGFLVTYLLLVEEQREGAAGRAPRFSIGRFWARRALRIWPLYYLGVTLALVILPRLPDPWHLGLGLGGNRHAGAIETYGVSAWTFLLNWTSIGPGFPPGEIGHLWSVSMEEQFYVLWPLVLAVLPRGSRRLWMIGILVAAALAKIPVLEQAASYRAAYLNTFLRADTFMAGALLADAFIRGDLARTPPRWLFPAVLAMTAVLLVAPPLETRGTAASVASYLALDFVGAGLVVLCISPTTRTASFLSREPMRWLGTISYGLYVFHPAVIRLTVVCEQRWPGVAVSRGLRAAVALAATIAIAALSYYAYEQWFLRLKHRFSRAA